MKLISIAQREKIFDTKLDTGLITEVKYDKGENLYIVKYDATDVGLPLGFSAAVGMAELFVKLTGKTAYVDLVVEFAEESEFCNSLCTDDYCAEFHVVLSTEETVELLIKLLQSTHVK